MSCARLPFRRTLAVTACGRWSVFDCIGYIGYLGFPVSHSVSRILHFCNWHLISKAAKLSIVFMHAALPLKVIPIVGTQSRLVETLGDPAHPRCSKLFTFQGPRERGTGYRKMIIESQFAPMETGHNLPLVLASHARSQRAGQKGLCGRTI